MTKDMSRLLRPSSIAVIGGGAWGASVVEQCRKMGFSGPIWPVHPSRDQVGGVPAFRSLADLPGAPDATFIGVNRHLTVDTVGQLAAMGARGAVCFASGFKEALAESADGADLQDALLHAAGDMAILGPNCYGLINYLDGALLWPDQHGGRRSDSGVALVTQSSNMAINLTMQARGLPVAYVVTAGNQAQTGLAGIGMGLLADPRVTALGLHIEGVGDIRAFEALAAEAARLGKPVVALKVGRSEQARAATVSHTASVAGSDAGGRALLARLGFAEVGSLPVFLETLKLLHFAGPLPSNRLASLSCSGGEASLIADSSLSHDVAFDPLTQHQRDGLRAALGPMVALANPLDYHTYIWGDTDAMGRTFAAMQAGDQALTVIVVDFPRTDRCSDAAWDCVIEGAAWARTQTGKPLALVTTLPENMSEAMADRIAEAGLIPMHGLDETLAAASAAAWLGRDRGAPAPVLLPGEPTQAHVLTEAEAKAALGAHGVRIPRSARATDAAGAAGEADAIGYPVVLKGEGAAHKTEAGLVALRLGDAAAVRATAERMSAPGYLVEEMIEGAVAELLVGVVRDPAHGLVLTLGAGGVLTELLADGQSLLVPASEAGIRAALGRLKVAKLLAGYRGKPAADIGAVVRAVMAVQDYVVAHAARLEEVEINPLICTATDAVAADALIRIGENG
jgi:acyl-CoA synthetase (NDP forming)